MLHGWPDIRMSPSRPRRALSARRRCRIPTVNAAQAIALAAFVLVLLAATGAGARMWALHQQKLAAVCGAIAAFVFLLGFWYLTTLP